MRKSDKSIKAVPLPRTELTGLARAEMAGTINLNQGQHRVMRIIQHQRTQIDQILLAERSKFGIEVQAGKTRRRFISV